MMKMIIICLMLFRKKIIYKNNLAQSKPGTRKSNKIFSTYKFLLTFEFRYSKLYKLIVKIEIKPDNK